MSLFLEPTIFGEAKSTDSRAMGFVTDARSHGENFENYVFQNPLLRSKSKKKRRKKEFAPSALLARSQFLLCLGTICFFLKLPRNAQLR